MRAVHRVRAAANLANLSTPAGMLLGRIGGAPPRRAGRGLWVGRGYGLAVPGAPAFTVGNVVLLRARADPGADPIGTIPLRLLAHEERHATQYAFCGGLVMPVLYVGCAAWSWWRTGDPGAANVFERRAGLADGGYRELPVRSSADARAALGSLVRRRVGDPLGRRRGRGAGPRW